MALIPTYQPDNIKPLDFSGIGQSMQNVNYLFKQRAQDQRLKKQAIQKAMIEYNSAEPIMKKHQEVMTEAIDMLQEEYANMLTYGEDGKVKRGFGEPKITDKEYLQWMQNAAKLGVQAEKWKKDTDQVYKEVEEYKKNTVKYDPRTFNLRNSDWSVTGEYELPLLEAAPANVYEYLSKLDPRTKDELSFATSKKAVGNEWEITIQSLNPEIQRQLYYTAANNDYAFQKGLVDMMMDDNALTKDQKIEYIRGIIAPNLPYDKPGEYMQNEAVRKQIFKAHEEAMRVVDEYEVERKFDPRIIDAAAHYNDERFGLSQRIGMGGSYRTPNETMINYDARKAREEKEFEPTEQRTYTIDGVPVEGVDLSRSTKTILSNFQLPKGSYTMEVGQAKSQLESMTERANELESKGEKKKAKEIRDKINKGEYSSETRQSTIKKTLSDTKTADYEVVTYGKDGSDNNVIVIKEPDTEDSYGKEVKGRYIFVPMEGNESILNQINKNFKKDQESQSDLIEIPGF